MYLTYLTCGIKLNSALHRISDKPLLYFKPFLYLNAKMWSNTAKLLTTRSSLVLNIHNDTQYTPDQIN